MRRGQSVRYSGPGFTKSQLMEAAGISAKIFDMIRKASRIKGPGHGGLDWLFTPEDVDQLIAKAKKGNFTEVGGGRIAACWQELVDGK